VTTEEEGADQTLPLKFGRYTLVERIATGGMAEVFKAKILATHGFEKLLVIKRILPHLAADKNFVSMFIDEAKLTAQLTHPKIVQVTDFGEVDRSYFIALEFIDGFDALALLRTSAQKQIRIPIPISVFIVMEVLDALDYAHNAVDREGKEMRLVHRDISPSNVFISHRGDVKLADFGIAHASERESKTQAGTLKGKYGYMSPEQVVGSKLDGRSDVFAVGIVLAEMLMGRRLFTAPTDLDVLLMVRDGRLERLDKYCKDIPPELDRIVRKSLKKRLGDRYQTAGEFRDDLADLMFRFGFRVGPRNLGEIAKYYFDNTTEGYTQLKEQIKKWAVTVERRARASSVPPKSAAAQQEITSPPGKLETGVATQPAARVRAESQVGSPTTVSTEEPTRNHGTGEAEDLDVVIDGDDSRAAIQKPAAAAASGMNDATRAAMASLDQAMSKPMSVVVLDDYDAPAGAPGANPGTPVGHHGTPTGSMLAPMRDTGPMPFATPPSYGAVPAGASSGSSGAINVGGAFGSPFAGGPPGTGPGYGAYPTTGMGNAPTTDLSQGLNTGARPPDKGGDLSVIAPMRVFADLAIAGETGLLRFELQPHVKEIYLVRGAPESINSSLKNERFGEYLVSRGFLTAQNLDMAMSQLPRFSGKVGDTLVGLGFMRPLDVFRLLSQQVRERVMDIFGWVQGYYSFYRNVRNPQEAFPLGLDTFEILGAGLLTLPYDFLERRFVRFLDYRPRANPYGRVSPESFRLGPTPREVLKFLDGSRTLREWIARFNNPEELLTFLRTLYLLVETDLATFM